MTANLAYGSRLTWRSRDQDWSGEAQRTIHFYRDSTAPTVVSVEITELSGSSFVLITFTEELHRARSPGIRHFLVKRTPTGGSEETVTQDRPPQLQGKDLTLELSETILSTDHVTVSYTQSSLRSQRLQDKFGNEVAIFTDVARKRHEPSGQDFSHSHDTPGFVGVGNRFQRPAARPERPPGRHVQPGRLGAQQETTASRSSSNRRAAPRGFSTRGTSGGTTTPPAPQWAATSGWRNVCYLDRTLCCQRMGQQLRRQSHL